MPRTDVTIFNVDSGEPGVVDATVQLTGVGASAEVNALSAESANNDANVDLSGIQVGGELGVLDAFGQGTPGTLGYPRVACTLISGSTPWGVNHPDHTYQMEGIAKLDYVMMQINPNIFPATVDGSTYLSAQTIVNELKALNPDLQIRLYVSVMELLADEWPGSVLASKVYSEAGPPGADFFWDAQLNGKDTAGNLNASGSDVSPDGPYAAQGVPVNDWWGRDKDGFKKSTFGSGTRIPFNVNICPGWATPDANGDIYPQVYFDNFVLPEILAPHDPAIGGAGYGFDGVGLFTDVVDDHPRSDTLDFNGDGRADSARTVYNPFDPAHVADPETATYGGGVYTAGKWREGHRLFHNVCKAWNSDLPMGHNCVTWSNQDESEGASVPVDVYPEYQLVQGTSIPLSSPTPRAAMTEGSLLEAMTKNTGFPVTGVDASGNLNGQGFPGASRGWWIAYNQYRHLCEISTRPMFAGVSGNVEAFDRISPDINGEARWDWVPSSGSAFALMRWLLTMALLDDGYFFCSAIQVGTTRTGRSSGACIFDEFGTINQSQTGLTKGYLGQPVEPPVYIPFVGSGNDALMKREYENGWAINTTSKQNTLTVPVAAIGGAGATRRINGVQDPSWNDGSTVNSDFPMPPINGIILLKN